MVKVGPQVKEVADAYAGVIAKVQAGSPVLQQAANDIENNKMALSKYAGRVKDWGAMIKTAFVNIGISLAISAALYGLQQLIKAVDDAIHATERHAEKLEEIKQEYAATESEIANLNKQLEETRSRLEELSKMPSLSVVEQGEYDNLVKVNAELERKLQIEEAIRKARKREAGAEFVATVESYLDDKVSGAGSASNKEYIDSLLKYIEERYKEAYFTTKDRDGNEVISVNQSSLDMATGWSDVFSNKYLAPLREYAKDMEYGISADVDAMLDWIANLEDKFLGLSDASYKASTAFPRIFSKEKFSSIRAELEGLSKAGKLTAETLNDPKYAAFINALSEVGISASDAADMINGVGNSAGASVTTASSSFSALQKLISDVSDEGKKALSELKENIETALDWRSTVAQQQQALDNLFNAIGVRLTAGAKGTTDVLQMIQAYVNGNVDAFQEYGIAAVKALGIKPDPKSLLNTISTLIANLSILKGEALETAQAMLFALSGMGAVKKTLKPAVPRSVTEFTPDMYTYEINSDFFKDLPKISGGGGSKSQYSKAYEEQKEITEHFIKMSELRQETMGEETDEWRNEQQKQYGYYMQISNLMQQEMERLKSKNTAAAKAALRSLEEEYQTVQNKLYSLQKAQTESIYNAQIKALEKEKDALEDNYDARVKDYEYRIDKTKALLSLEENYHELQKSILAEQRSLTNEFEKSRMAADQSDPSLFNEEDYANLSGKLSTIQGELDGLYNNYLTKIQSITVDTAYQLDYITSQFEQQVKLKNAEYQIAKNELAVAKARIELENVQKERSVAQLKDGKWVWGSDPEAVKQAMDALTEAENVALDAEADFLYQQKVAAYEETIASIEMQKKLAEKEHDAVMERIEQQIEALNEQLSAMTQAIMNMNTFSEGVEDAFTALAGVVARGVSAVSAAAASAASAAIAAGDYTSAGSASSSQMLLKSGSSGDAVTTIQQVLADNGYLNKNGVDGKYGSQTTAAVKAMQKDLGVKSDGIVGSETLAAMAKKYGTSGSYATGGVNTAPGVANLHGTESDPEVIFNSSDAAKLFKFVTSTKDIAATLIGDIRAQLAGRYGQSPLLGQLGIVSSKSNAQPTQYNAYIDGIHLEGMNAKAFISALERAGIAFNP